MSSVPLCENLPNNSSVDCLSGRALTCCGFTVSGSLSLPSPGFFSPFPHGTSSLSVVTEYLAFDRGRPGFRQDSTCPAVLRYRPTESPLCRIRGFHPLCPAFPNPSAILAFSRNSAPHGQTALQPHPMGGLGSSDFARRYFRNLILISSPGVLRWFSSPSFASAPYVFRCRMTVSLPPGYPIRLSADRRICAPPRSFSQLVTAFFASLLQGIHHKPFSRLTILLSTRILRLPTHYPVESCCAKLLLQNHRSDFVTPFPCLCQRSNCNCTALWLFSQAITLIWPYAAPHHPINMLNVSHAIAWLGPG